MLIVVHFSHLMYLNLNSGLRQFERQYRNISVGFAIDLSDTCQCRSTLTITFTLLVRPWRTENSLMFAYFSVRCGRKITLSNKNMGTILVYGHTLYTTLRASPYCSGS